MNGWKSPDRVAIDIFHDVAGRGNLLTMVGLLLLIAAVCCTEASAQDSIVITMQKASPNSLQQRSKGKYGLGNLGETLTRTSRTSPAMPAGRKPSMRWSRRARGNTYCGTYPI